jgi:hypothetical protein
MLLILTFLYRLDQFVMRVIINTQDLYGRSGGGLDNWGRKKLISIDKG